MKGLKLYFLHLRLQRHVTYEVINVFLMSHLNLHLALSTNTLHFDFFSSLKHYLYFHQMVICPVLHLRGHDLVNGIQELKT